MQHGQGPQMTTRTTHMKDGEEDEEGVDDECQDVAERHERERHRASAASSRECKPNLWLYSGHRAPA